MVSHSWAFAPVATATPNYANFRQRKPAPVSTGASEQAGALLAVPTVSREGGGAQSPRAAVPTPEMLTLRACLRSILFSPVVPSMAPPPARATSPRGARTCLKAPPQKPSHPHVAWGDAAAGSKCAAQLHTCGLKSN